MVIRADAGAGGVGQNGQVRIRAAVERVRLLLRPSGPLPPVSWRGQLFDAGLAVALMAVALVAGDNSGGDVSQKVVVAEPEVPRLQGLPVPPHPRAADPFLPIQHDQTGTTVLMFAIVVLPLLLRRRYPLAMLWVVLAVAPVISDNDAALRVSFYACVIAAYAAAVYSRYRIPALASLPFAAFLYTQIREPAVPTVPDDAVPFLILIPIAIAAEGLRRWKRRADEDRAQLSTMEREQAEALRRAAEHERARIARELHDVVTHNVSVMVIQAGAARKVMQASPDQAHDALLAVEAGGRAAMTELRHVMGLLTMDGEDGGGAPPPGRASPGPAPAATPATPGRHPAAPAAPGLVGAAALAPQPGLDRLEALVQRVRDTGMATELRVTGDRRPLPPGLELAAYRVVQEALTNTVKHAVGARAAVLVDYGLDELRVEVTDTGGTAGEAADTGNGYGLIGLRERLAVYGGTLLARRRLSGGYRVLAQIPLEVS